MANIKEQSFGKLGDGREIKEFTVTNARGTTARFISYGARLVSLAIKDGDGKPIDVILGYADIDAYQKDDKFMGAIAGRHANRIAGAEFSLNGRTFQLAKNDGRNHLHGGKEGFDKKVWSGKIEDGTLVFTYTSPDGEENYPGELVSSVRYTLSDEDELIIDYEAAADEDTVCNLTNHAYFNLDGFGYGDIRQHKMQIFADHYTAADAELLPDGRILPVDGTSLDFREAVPIGAHIDDDCEAIRNGHGYDHNWCIKKEDDGELVKAAFVEAASSGVSMEVFTTSPGIQFYSGNFLNADLAGKEGVKFPYRSGFCLETQYYPNALANPSFPQPILRRGKVWKARTVNALKTR